MHPFVSTRGPEEVPFRTALFRGLAPDGGLYVPRELRALTSPPPRTLDLVSVTRWVAPVLFPGVDPEVIEEVAAAAFTFPIPLVEVEAGVHVLELFHGPTHAFKDVGARFLSRLMEAIDEEGTRRTVLVATSGDTGGAVADAFFGMSGIDVVVLFPRDGVSDRQRRQMTTLGGNVTALAVAGSFDDCQRIAKEAFLDVELSERWGLTSANSINIGRLLPQVIYYVYAAAKIGWASDCARFIVPSGNLGNLCAGLLARRLGMPSRGFVAATNANRMFVDVLAGEPFCLRPALPTASNAMDVADPSNLERIRWLYGGDMARLRDDVIGISVSDESAHARIRDVYERCGYVMDPHTAVAYEAHQRHGGGSSEPHVVLATAHPAKFPDLTEAAIGREVPLPIGLARTLDREEHMTDILPTLSSLTRALRESVA